MSARQPQGGPAAISRRAALKRGIAAGEIDLPAVLKGTADEGVESEAMAMRVADLVAAVPGIGDDTVDRILSARAGARTKLCDLTIAARRAIAEAIRSEVSS